MRYLYWKPAADLCAFVGSYYALEAPQDTADITRAEIPHIRFLLSGESVLQHGDVTVPFTSPCALVCGPSMRAGQVSVSAGSLIAGASLTPVGWQAMFGAPLHELRDRKAMLDDFHPINPGNIQDRLLSARDDIAFFAAMDDIFRSLVTRATRPFNEAFVAAASEWLLDGSSPGVSRLVNATDISHRQLDRLCNIYFGASPKRLHRVFRALHVSTRLALSDTSDWREAVGEQYHDQSHFIRDFKDLIGCTPGEFMRGKNLMIRFDLMKRLAVPHETRFSLIG